MTVEVSISDLEIIRATLNSAYHQNTVIDLAESYRRLNQRSNSSAMTKSLKASLDKVSFIIEGALDEEEPIEEEQESR